MPLSEILPINVRKKRSRSVLLYFILKHFNAISDGARGIDEVVDPSTPGTSAETVARLTPQPHSPRTGQYDDARSVQTSYTDGSPASISDISSVVVPFFEHIKAARRAGIPPPFAARAQPPPNEEETLLDSQEPSAD